MAVFSCCCFFLRIRKQICCLGKVFVLYVTKSGIPECKNKNKKNRPEIQKCKRYWHVTRVNVSYACNKFLGIISCFSMFLACVTFCGSKMFSKRSSHVWNVSSPVSQKCIGWKQWKYCNVSVTICNKCAISALFFF